MIKKTWEDIDLALRKSVGVSFFPKLLVSVVLKNKVSNFSQNWILDIYLKKRIIFKYN